MKRSLLVLTFLFLTSLNAHALKLYLLSNHGNAGDHNSTLGIAAALEKLSRSKIPFEDINIKNETPAEIRASIEKDLSVEKVIVVGTGEGGIEGIKDLSVNPNLYICLTSHMFLKNYEDPALLAKVNYIALPTHVSMDVQTQLGSKLLETTGVAHNRQVEIAGTTYTKWKSELPACKTYLGVILGGDAPTPSKEMKLFTESDAKKLAEYVATHAKNACVLVLNGPRTGKHDDDKNEITTSHKDGKLDHITAIFKESLEAKLGSGKVKVFDFQFDQKPPYNAFDLVAGAVKATNGTMIVPGESTSMVSEAVDILPQGHILVYEDSAMNEVHRAHLASELHAGRILLLENYKDTKSPAVTPSEAQPSAATVIAQKLWETVNR